MLPHLVQVSATWGEVLRQSEPTTMLSHLIVNLQQMGAKTLASEATTVAILPDTLLQQHAASARLLLHVVDGRLEARVQGVPLRLDVSQALLQDLQAVRGSHGECMAGCPWLRATSPGYTLAHARAPSDWGL